jgi:FemAB-related protein (PEP-CTERM system-associated)
MTAIAEPVGALASRGAAEPFTVTTDLSVEDWNRFVASHSEATGYHRAEWRTVFERGLGYRCHYLAVRSGAAVHGVLPLVEVRSRLFGRALSSLPYVNYGGLLATTPQAAEALLAAANELAGKRRLNYVLLRHRRQQLPQLPARTHKVTMLLRLEPDAERMWTALDRKVRNQVRKGEKSGLDTLSGGAELLEDFYRVFAQNMRDLGTPVYGRGLFAEILRQFPNDARIHLVRLGTTTIAGALSYGWNHVVEVPSASSLKEHRSLCPNHLMYWHVIRQAIQEGRSIFDFGRSTPGDGTYHFKEQWGAIPEQLWWEYSLIGGGALPSADRHDASYQRRIEYWKKVPLPLANLLGPRIARSVP